MTKSNITHIVYTLMKDEYYKQLRELENDIEFFLLYMERNKKSPFRFQLKISHASSFHAFDDIWKKYGYQKDEIETAFSEYMMLRLMIIDIYENTNIFKKDCIKEFITYFEQYEDTKILNYISDFIGCSRGCTAVARKIETLLQGD